MTFREYLRILRERWFVIALATLISLGATAGAWTLQPRHYTAKLTTYVSATVETAGSALQGAQLSEQMAASYVELITSPRVTGQVVQDLGLAESSAELASRITATNTPGSVFVAIAVADDDPQRAADIANAVGQVFSTVVDEIEAPTTPGAAPSVAVRAIQPATAPSESSSTPLSVALALGLFAGLAIGIGGALARHHLDTRIRSLQQLRAAVDAPVLGITASDPGATRRPLVMQEEPHSPCAEAYRQLRTNLLFVHGDRQRRVFAVTSATAREGKTTTLANLAVALAGARRRVAVVEADLRQPKLAQVLAVDGSIGLTDVLERRAGLNEALQRWSETVNVLPAGSLPSNPGELLASPQMNEVLQELRARHDMVLIDTPPLLTLTDAASVAPATDGAILVSRYKGATRDQLKIAVQALRAVSTPLIGTVLTVAPASGPFTEIVAPATRMPVATTVVPSPEGAQQAPPAPAPQPASRAHRHTDLPPTSFIPSVPDEFQSARVPRQAQHAQRSPAHEAAPAPRPVAARPSRNGRP